jgi:hypothetical protein
MVPGECRAQELHYGVVVVALDGRNCLTLARHGEGDARAHGLAVKKNGARATYAVLAAEVRTSQMQFVTQEVSQVCPRLGIPTYAAAVHLNGN